MCYDGKCLHCLEVETGTMIYAIIKVIFTSIATVVTVGTLIFFNVALEMSQNNEPQTYGEMDANEIQTVVAAVGLVSNIGLVIILSIVGVAFAFSIVLLVGICKKKAGHVKAYFIYGLLNLVIVVVICLIGLFSLFDPQILYTLLGFCVIDGLLLHMIRSTYLKFQNGRVYQIFNNAPNYVEKF